MRIAQRAASALARRPIHRRCPAVSLSSSSSALTSSHMAAASSHAQRSNVAFQAAQTEATPAVPSAEPQGLKKLQVRRGRSSFSSVFRSTKQKKNSLARTFRSTTQPLSFTPPLQHFRTCAGAPPSRRPSRQTRTPPTASARSPAPPSPSWPRRRQRGPGPRPSSRSRARSRQTSSASTLPSARLRLSRPCSPGTSRRRTCLPG